jgi:predicted nucleotidyltransferase
MNKIPLQPEQKPFTALKGGPLLERIRAKRAAILEMAAAHGAKSIAVFGSVVRGEETASSDVDFVVEFATPHTIWQWIRLQNDLAQLLECKVDVSVKSQLHPAFRDQVLREAIPL